AEILEELNETNRLIVFRLLKKDNASEVFSFMSSEERLDIVSGITEQKLKDIFSDLHLDDKVDLLEEVPATVVRKLLAASNEKERNLLNQFLNYKENSAGSLMTIEYVALRKEMSVKEAIEHIRKNGVDKETIYTCYIKDEQNHLVGLLSLRKLVLSNAEQIIEEIMTTDIVKVDTDEDQEVISQIFKKYDLIAVPVVDTENRMVGIITVDDIVDVIEEENTEDFEKMAALIPNEDEYFDSSVFQLSKKRVVWLLVLMLSATFTGKIIHYFEDALAATVLLAAYIPMLMGTGGNAGAQSSTLIIRGMAVGQIEISDLLRVFFKEFRVSIIVGLCLATANFIRVILFDNVGIFLALTVSITLVFTVVFAKLIGGSLPIIVKIFKMDPAMMASPIITTIVDALSLYIYFSIANLIIRVV
ncbi:MAG: magnesium transporter, partial [Candidatus Cloacimonetes bacterium]|nr:magnesium transporter [Candidatus Cloacimonadota bacterium]